MRKEERESKYDYYDIFSIFENGDDGQEEAGRWLVVVSDSICTYSLASQPASHTF